jgi:NADH-quinone oxidoreductase subunit L
MDYVIEHSWLIPLLPLIGAAIAGFLGAKWLKGQSHWPIWIGVGISAVLSLTLLVTMFARTYGANESDQPSAEVNKSVDWFTWIDVGNPRAVFQRAASDATQPTTATSDPTQTPAPGTWIDSQTHQSLGQAPVHFVVVAGAWFDPLTAVMLSVVCGIGFVITVYAAGYMKGEAGYFRFFAYLGLFIFMMTCLVMGNNLIMLYLGWEGVGLCSYLLIGYYYEKPAAREAAKKAFLVNRVGDFGFGLGIMLSFLAFGTVSYFGQGIGTHTGLLELATGTLVPGGMALTAFQEHALKWLPFLLMVGAFGKSAQFPLYVWLPDAMEGPTPVSALIHAATMVTAGVYMVARCGTLFVGNQAAMLTIAIVGAFTALFAATIALRQFDLKKVFAYSTISQLGYMFVGVGVLAPVGAVFHLVTHAFFKALLFLASGVVMHAMGGVLDMRQMSGLKRALPKTRWLMLIGCLALAGMFPLAGFFSKDEIIGASFESKAGNAIIGCALLLAAFLTAYYTFRLYFRVFEGPYVIPAPPEEGHGAHAPDPGAASHSAIETGTAAQSGVDKHLDSPAHRAATDHGHGGHGAHNHEPALMIVPLIVLAIGAVFAGLFNFPSGSLGGFLGKGASFLLAGKVAVNAIGDTAAKEGFTSDTHGFNVMMLVSFVVASAGIVLAWFLHLRNRALDDRLAAGLQPLTTILEAKYWVDQIYQAVIVEPLRSLGNFFFGIDRYVIDILIAIVSWIPQAFGWIMKFTVQRGSLQGYASAMLFGIVIILLLVFMHR